MTDILKNSGAGVAQQTAKRAAAPVSSGNASHKDLSSEDLSSRDASSRDLSTGDLSSGNASPEDVPAKEMNDNHQIDIETGELLTKVMEFKKKGLRLSQACAAYYEGQYELSYSFADDVTYDYYTLRLRVDMDEEIPSITEIIPMAVFYENEMAEMYGVKIEMISVDYHNKLYRIEEDAPLLPREAKDERESNRENRFNNLRV